MLVNVARRQWFARHVKVAKSKIASGGCYRPRLEVLEDRSTPSLVTVTSVSDDPSDSGSLRHALANATPGETIDFAPNVRAIRLSNTLNTTGLTIPVNLSIINDQGFGPVTIDGGGNFIVFTVGDVTASLSGLIISDGSTNLAAGGIENNGTLTIKNCTVSNSANADIQNYGTLAITDSTFSNDRDVTIMNSAGMVTVSGSNFSNDDGGGAIQNEARLSIDNCTFSNNSAGSGACINNDGAVWISNSTFSNNAATSGNGGCIKNDGAAWISNSTFSNNTARSGNGGGIYVGGALTVINSTFSSNLAASGGNGGAIAVDGYGGTVTVSDSTFAGNSAGSGGAINNGFGSGLTVNNCTFCYNSAESGGGGAITSVGELLVEDSSISSNTVSNPGDGVPGVGNGGGISTSDYMSLATLDGDIVAGNANTYAGTVPDDVAGAVGPSSSDNLIGTGGSGGLLDGENGNQVGASVADVGLGPLANNGGPTQTLAIGAGSFAIGKGYTATTATTDQRGVARPIGQPSDVGAYQYSAPPTVTANPVAQTIIVGQDTSFAAAASDGVPSPTTVQWQISIDNGNSFTNLSNDSIYSGVTAMTLMITGASVMLSGDQYRAVFTNAAGLSATTAGATLIVGDPASVVPFSGAVQSITVTSTFAPLEVFVSDNLGRPVSGASVRFTVQPGSNGSGGTFAGNATVTTNAEGVATAPTLTATQAAGTFTVSATVGGVADLANFNLSATPGSAAQIVAAWGTPQSTPIGYAFSSAIQAKVTDGYGNPIAGAPVSFTVPDTGPTGSFDAPATVLSDPQGIATAPTLIANNQLGTFTAIATVVGLPAAAYTLANLVGAPALISTYAGNNQSTAVTTGFATALSVLVTDAFGNPVPGASVTFNASDNGTGPGAAFGANGQSTAVTNAQGIATAPALVANQTAGTFAVSAAVGNLSTTFALTNTSATAMALIGIAGGNQSTTASTVFGNRLAVLAIDAFGNAVPGLSVTFTAPNSAGSAGASFADTATVVTNSHGLAIAPALTANATAGSYTVAASGGGLLTTFGLSSTSGSASSIVTAGGTPQSTPIGTAFGTVQAEVVDANNNPVPNVVVTFALPALGPSGTFSASPTVLTNAQGIATAPTITANHIQGTFTVTATAAGVASPADFALTNTAIPATIRPIAGTPQIATVNTAYQKAMQARVTDSHGKPVVGITVVFELPAGPSGTFAGSADVVTNSTGIAIAPALTANTVAGAFTVDAWVAGINTPAAFTLRNTPLGPKSIIAFAGTPQTAVAGVPYATALQVRVMDKDGNPVSGVTVTFTAPTSGPSGTLKGKKTTTAVTGVNGIAVVAITANTAVGTFQVTATVAHLSSTAIFTLTNLPVHGTKTVAPRRAVVRYVPPTRSKRSR
jgi:predicted outer membrane repeat protein